MRNGDKVNSFNKVSRFSKQVKNQGTEISSNWRKDWRGDEECFCTQWVLGDGKGGRVKGVRVHVDVYFKSPLARFQASAGRWVRLGNYFSTGTNTMG